MHAVGINEFLKHAMPLVLKDGEKRSHLAARIPLLTHSVTKEETDEALREAKVLFGTGMVPPFQSFRFDIWCQDALRCNYYGICDVFEKEARVLFKLRFDKQPEPYQTFYFSIMNLAEDGQGISFDTRVYEEKTGRELGDSEIKREGKQHLSIWIHAVITTLIYDYTSPQNFQVRVSPATKGKSVEWTRAREHFTIVNRRHAANNAEVKVGAVVHESTEKQLKRCAHSRRAHIRIFKSDRYKAMKGKQIIIKAMWVGPKEWQDAAGQIYKIIT